MAHPYLAPLIKDFESHRNPEIAVYMKKYMKDQFEFYGIKTPVRKQITKEFFKKYGLLSEEDLEQVIRECWEMDQREMQFFAIGMLERYIKRSDRNIIDLLEYMIINKSWWDTVDGTASLLVGPLFKKHPALIKPRTTAWMDSGNIWLQRTCLLFQLNYKTATDLDLLFDFIDRLSDSKVFWIRKAIGWILREYSKTDSETVQRFVDTHQLSPLSRREALKVINRKFPRQDTFGKD